MTQAGGLTVGVVEDDPVIRRVVVGALELAGHRALVAHDGGEALSRLTDAAALTGVDVVVLDIGLPDADGRDVCQALRTAGQVAPVIFLTALGAVHDRLSGFSAGADDYLAKPFDVKELLARVEALGRRGRLVAPQTPGDLVLDPARHALACGGRSVSLTPTEFRMLAAITSRPGEVVRRRAVVAAAWPDGAIVSENTVDSYVRRLRAKLEEIASPVRLHTVRGVGYELR
ncbi:response regulator transcription factor [Nocardioides sp. TRM66260-LWL]|uniref:response regulator transcription factor n=1 Tax=Nocardioides sp. TRM66260-LWL TaxID=2874478 RepID=UPI001CC80EB5|nr:response regulator transcription factor [Nocardioides sp. TRM66260-LWL]MBZ5735932.1 response regulator transcription factor [Nocardioides sp. TRM66260-LWL]